MEWAAAPATIARASSVSKREASRCADDKPLIPNIAVARGSLGIERNGAKKFGRMPSAWRTSGAKVRR